MLRFILGVLLAHLPEPLSLDVVIKGGSMDFTPLDTDNIASHSWKNNAWPKILFAIGAVTKMSMVVSDPVLHQVSKGFSRGIILTIFPRNSKNVTNSCSYNENYSVIL